MSTTYWAAGHITGFFQIQDSDSDLLNNGSRGAGFTIKRGVKTKIENSFTKSHKIYFNGVEQLTGRALITECILELMKDYMNSQSLRISHFFEIPIGSGFGASAAGAVGSAFAIRDHLNLNLSDLDLWQLAHSAEIITKSGLGDILGLYGGGLTFREVAGAPGVGKVKKIPGKFYKLELRTISFNKISTHQVLSNPDLRNSINKYGSKVIDNFKEKISLNLFLISALEFTNNLTLFSPRLKKLLASLNIKKDLRASQIMLGDGLFLFSEKNTDLSILDPFSFTEEQIVLQTIKKIE